MASFKKKSELEFNSGNNNISESFDFNVEATMNGLGEDFVFKFEDNKVTATNDVALTGLEENDESASNASAKQQNIDDNNQKNRNRNNNNTNESSSETTEAASESGAAASSSSSSSATTSAGSSAGASTATTASASVTSAVGTVAAVATTAVVLVVGGSIAVYGQTLEKPQIVEFESLASTENTIKFTLLVGNDRNAINNKEQDDAAIVVELTCDSYSNFIQEIEFKKYGRLENQFNDLEPGTEYTINVLQKSLMDLNKDYLIDPIKVSTVGGTIAPMSFAISPSQARIEADQTIQFSIVDVLPENADDSVIWSSSDESVATVDANGFVSGVASSVSPITITATSMINNMVKATATLYVDPATPKYSPNFEKVIDPFGTTQMYMTWDVKNETRNLETVELTAHKINRETGEEDPEFEDTYCTFTDQPNVRQVLSFYPEELDPEAMYTLHLEGFVPDEGQPDPDPDSSQPQSEGEWVTLYDGSADFAEVPSKIAGQDIHSNSLYLRQNSTTDGTGTILENGYEAFLDTVEVNGLFMEDGSAITTYYVGVFPTSAEDSSYGSQFMMTSFIIEEARTIVPISFDDSQLSDWEWLTYNFIIFTENDRVYTEVFREELSKGNVTVVKQSMAQDYTFEKEIDPFGNTNVYCQLELNVPADLSEGYFTFKELDRSTGEETGGELYAMISDDPKNRQIMNFSDGTVEINYDGLYSYTFQAFVAGTGQQGDGNYYDLIVDREIDFSTVTTTVVGQGTHSDHLYLRHVFLTDAADNELTGFDHYDAYLDLKDIENASSNPRTVGVFRDGAEDLEYGSNDMLTSFKLYSVGTIIESLDFDARNLNTEANLTFVVFETIQNLQDEQYVQEFTQTVRLDSVAYRSMGFIGNGSYTIQQTMLSHHRIFLTLGGNHFDLLPEDWTLSVFEKQSGEECETGVSFYQADNTGELYYYDVSPDYDSFFEYLSIQDQVEREIRVMTSIDGSDVTLFVIDVDPSKAENCDLVDCCAEFRTQYKETTSDGNMYNVFLHLYFKDLDTLLVEYDSILVNGDIGMGSYQYEISITDESDLGGGNGIKLIDKTSGQEITIEEEYLSSIAMGYNIYGVSGQDQILLFSESNDIH